VISCDSFLAISISALRPKWLRSIHIILRTVRRVQFEDVSVLKGLESHCASRIHTAKRLNLKSKTTADLLAKRLQWWLLIALALGLVSFAAFGPAEGSREFRIFAAAAVTLLAIGVLVDQVLQLFFIKSGHATTRDALVALNRRLVLQANTDPLTGLYNRRGLESFFDGLVSTRRFRYQPIALLMIDVDGFKAFNDRHGHSVGDQILHDVAGLLRSSLRRSDGIGRWGGDEFCVILPNTALSQARSVAAKLCAVMSSQPFRVKAGEAALALEIRMSIGVGAVDAADTISLNHVVDLADQALYQAKAAGGNTAVGIRMD